MNIINKIIQGVCFYMLLSSTDYKKLLSKGEIIIDPYPSEEAMGPASVDLTLGNEFLIFNEKYYPKVNRQYRHTAPAYKEECVVDIKNPEYFKDLYIHVKKDSIILYPGDFILGTTRERVAIPGNIAAILSGRSSLGRLGIQVHATAGFIDPGFDGKITLEISNISPVPIKLYAGMRIGQLHFYRLSSNADVLYSDKTKTKYSGQDTVRGSEIWKDFAVNEYKI